ncbi:MAG TPA: holo-ACP synthase [Symbiobacteriaceae bacterium]
MIFGIGVDIIEVHRVSHSVARFGDKFLGRVFTPGEIADCAGSGPTRDQRLAARFAAKEAALKALGTGLRGVKWTDVEVVKDSLGKPSLRLWGQLRALAEQQGVTQLHVSLSHCKEYAMAQVVAVQ